MSKTLLDIQNINQFKTDKNSWHTYLDTYEKLFNRFTDKDINLFEIGVLKGESLKLWSKYLPKSKIYGCDIFTRVSFDDVESNLYGFDNIFLADVDSFNESEIAVNSRTDFLDDIGDTMFDIIIDDGHHNSESQIKTFNNFIHKLNPNGVYVIEDIMDWDGHLGRIQEELPDVKIITLESNMGGRNDNILGVYSKDESFYDGLEYE
jgi:SAM-dependent methyltransferase